MGFGAGDKEKYQITPDDAPVIQAYQVCKAFHCLDLNVYRKNPAWWNAVCHALIRTENKAQSDRMEQNG